MNFAEMISDVFGGEHVVPILAVRKVVGRQVCSGDSLACPFPRAHTQHRPHAPRQDDLIIHPVQLHMLQAPALVDPPRDVPLAQARQVRRVVHADLDAAGTELGHQRRQQRRARGIRRLARAAERVRQDAQLQLRVARQGLAQRLDQLALGLADVQRREEDAVLCVADAVLQFKRQTGQLSVRAYGVL